MSTTSQQFPEFYKKHGILRLDSLTEPDPTLVKRLPVESCLHILGTDENPELDVSDPLLKGYTEKVRYMDIVHHDPAHNHGTYSPKSIVQDQALFKRKNRNFELVRELKNTKTTTSKQLLVFNYGYMDLMYRYPEDKISSYYRIEDKLYAVTSIIKRSLEIEPRNHFVILPIPAQLIAKSILDRYAQETPPKLASLFPGEDEQLLRQMWNFINPQLRPTGIWGEMTPQQLRKINLVFKSYDGKLTVLNLGYLQSWVRGSENLTLMNSVLVKGFEDVQKYYLRSMMTLREIDLRGAALAAQLAAEEEQKRLLQEADDALETGEVSEKDDRFLQDVEQTEAALRIQGELAETEEDPSVLLDVKKTGVPGQTGTLGEVEAETLAINEEDVDRDIQALEVIEANRAKSLEQVKANENADTYSSDVPATREEIMQELFKEQTPEQTVLSKLEALAQEGRVTSPEFRKKSQLAKQSGANKDPYGSGKTIQQASLVRVEDLVIKEQETVLNVPATVIDKSMAKSTLPIIGRKYNNSVLKKDILACVQGVQKSGVIIKNHQVDRITTALGDYDVHTLELVPIDGQPSIIRQRIPVVNEDGTFTAKGVKYRLRSQFFDVPIRKIGEHRVGLSSYYGKTFVDRATKKANSSLAYVIARLNKATIQPDEWLRDVSPGMVFDNYFEAPYIYSGLSEHFQSFRAGNMNFDFNCKGWRTTIEPGILARLENNGRVVCGSTDKQEYIVVDKDGMFYKVSEKKAEEIGNIYNILKLDESLAPVDYAEISVYSKGVPVGMFLAQQIGFRKLVKMLGAKHRIVEGRKQKDLQPHEYVVQFRDFAFIFDRREAVNSLILGGFIHYEKDIKMFDAKMFDTRDVYLRILEAKGLNSYFTGEMANMRDLFIDPITERILKEMGEPTNFNQLVIRSCELLQTYYYPDSQDANYQRIRGYDRFAGFFYKELANAIRQYKNKNRTGRAKVDASPYALWTTLTRDSAVKHAEDINPVQDVKITQEAVTYVGEGGRGKESMNRASRAYTKSNLGMLSEASVDSSDVGINAFLSADPGFANLDGMPARNRQHKATNLLSTSALLAPFSTYDDQKRIGFISIQQAHTIATDGYQPSPIRTGYESVIGMRTSGMFAQVAKMDGVVRSVTDSGVIVEYSDGTKQGYEVGTLYGKAEGSVYPHNVKAVVKVGQRLKKDDYITYNTKFFTPDPILPGGIVYKGGLMALAVLVETARTHEDSSVISRNLSRRLRATTTKVKTYTVNFKQNVLDVVKIGQKVKPEDILMTIEDEITAMDDSFKDSSLQILSERSKNSPRSSYIGTVSNIEVLYHGDLSDMSASLKSLATKSDKLKAEKAKSVGKEAASGFVNSDLSVNGTPLAVNKAVIRVYIDVEDDPATGDKIVVGNQLKSVIGEVMDYTLRTESGEVVDLQFGAKSFAARIVNSLIMFGVRAAALKGLEKAADKLYRQ